MILDLLEASLESHILTLSSSESLSTFFKAIFVSSIWDIRLFFSTARAIQNIKLYMYSIYYKFDNYNGFKFISTTISNNL